MPYEMMEHLQTKISKVTNKDKVQLKQEVLITWEQLQVLLAYFKQIEKARKQLVKWSVKVYNDDLLIHVMSQMYKSDWFLEETIMVWEDTQDIKNILEAAYIARKRYNEAKGQTHESLNKITKNELQMYLDAIKMKAMQKKKAEMKKSNK